MADQNAEGPTPHGKKRRALDDLKNEQRLAKRFDLLNLEQNGKLFVPVTAPLSTPPAASYSPASESMFVDDTPYRTYIHNLDAELDDIERSEEDKVIFLPDIEKKLAKIPKGVLTGEAHPSTHQKQMVLYKVPESLSVPKEKDQVRKAIIESRARARESLARPIHNTSGPSSEGTEQATERYSNGDPVTSNDQSSHVEDRDAMDLG